MAQPLLFTFVASRDSNDHEIRPQVGSVDVIDSIETGFLGMDPPAFFAQAALTEGGPFLIARCSCGEVGCGALSVTAEMGEDEVVWRLGAGAPLRFDRAAYLESLQAAREDTSWETVERTAERLVTQLDFSFAQKKGYGFHWASARVKPKAMALSFDKDGHQALFYVRWDGRTPSDAVARVSQWIAEGVLR